jgi:peptidyl-tRNA hydrolase, PTH1 family
MSRFGRLFDKFRPARATDRDQAHQPRTETRWVVVGLGNPGEQYSRSRHNAGFMVMDRLAARGGVELNRRKFNGFYNEIRLDRGTALIVKPQTFYNRSGDCVGAILGYFKVPVERLIVVHDEMDLPAGQLRVRRGSSDAGNRGVRSIIDALGSQEFIRVRVGVAHPEGAGDSIDHLITPLDARELRAFAPAFERAADAVLAIMRDGLERAMNVYNQRL